MNRLTSSISLGAVLLATTVALRGCLGDLDDWDSQYEQPDSASGTTSQGGYYYGSHYGGYHGGYYGGSYRGSAGGDTHAGFGSYGHVGGSVRGGFGGSAHGGGS